MGGRRDWLAASPEPQTAAARHAPVLALAAEYSLLRRHGARGQRSPGCSSCHRAGMGEMSSWYRTLIDITFDFRSDTPGYGLPGVDPDSSSPTLRRYHQLLWSKPLPNGVLFELDVAIPPYLHHLSELGEFWLTSDSVIPSWSKWKKMAHITGQIPEAEREEFIRIGYTIGGMMIWPGNKIGGAMTINGARGWDSKIADRFDLTLECVRRYYLRKPSPTGVLSPTLARYPEFFALFLNFVGFVDFFLLQDLVDETTSTVKFFTPFADFTTSPLPGTLDAYRVYRERSIEFMEARNHRIAAYESERLRVQAH
jgi:hypothetical protein